MITDKGKSIIAKFMAGQTQTYGSHIAVGCGHVPGSALGSSANTKALGFEMVRVPVSSISIMEESGVDKLVFSAELPTQNRYSITEVGLYPSATNSISTSASRSLFDFTLNERWEIHEPTRTLSVPDYSNYPLGDAGVINIHNNTNIANFVPVFSVAADDSIFSDDARLLSKEQPRMFTETVFMRGNTSALSTVDGYLGPVAGTDSTHIHYTGASVQLDGNSSEDLIKLVVGVHSIDPSIYPETPEVSVLVQFSSDETEAAGGQFANFQYTSSANNLGSNAYLLIENDLSNIVKTELFSWSQAKIVKVFVSVAPSITTKSYSITDNVATIIFDNPTYFSVGYPVTISGLANIANGTYTLTAVDDDAKTISFAYTHANVSNTSDTDGTAKSASGAYYVSIDAMRFENIYDAKINPLYGLVAYSDVSKSVGIANNQSATVAVTKNQNENTYIQIKIPIGVETV